MAEPAYRRVIVKVSGEAFSGPNDFGIHAPTIEAITKLMLAAGLSTEGQRPKHIDSYEKPVVRPKSPEPPK